MIKNKVPTFELNERQRNMPLFTWEDSKGAELEDSRYLTASSITITGRAFPEFAAMAWSPFILKLETYFTNKQVKLIDRPTFVVNIDLDFYNTSSTIYITMIFVILQNNWSKCDCVVNWHYSEEERDESEGEMYRDSLLYRKIKVNLVSRDN